MLVFIYVYVVVCIRVSPEIYVVSNVRFFFSARHWRWEAPSTPPWRFPLLDGGPTLCWLYLGDDVD